MKRKITKKIEKAIEKKLKVNATEFFKDAIRWVEAVNEGRLTCYIISVSRSGMTRRFKYLELKKYDKRYLQQNFVTFLRAMFRTDKDYNIVVNGCGMDMNFYVNYEVIHTLKNIGIISDRECRYLAQQTPHVT
jgi:hypothetical protein